MAEVFTPRGNGKELTALLHSFNVLWDLDLPVPEDDRSPSQIKYTHGEACVESAKFLFWRKWKTKRNALEWTQKHLAPALNNTFGREQRTMILAQALKDEVRGTTNAQERSTTERNITSSLHHNFHRTTNPPHPQPQDRSKSFGP